ncbi:unnamed protein product [Victoria cruziana]
MRLRIRLPVDQHVCKRVVLVTNDLIGGYKKIVFRHREEPFLLWTYTEARRQSLDAIFSSLDLAFESFRRK